jgi:hypothetical protein
VLTKECIEFIEKIKNNDININIYDFNDKKNYISKNGIDKELNNIDKNIYIKEQKNEEDYIVEILNLFDTKRIITIDLNNKNQVQFESNTYNQPIPFYKYDKNTFENNLYGAGIKKKGGNLPKRKNKLLNIGRINILYDKLINDNILSIKDEKDYKYKHLTNKKVSDNLIDIIVKLSNEEDVKQKEINSLNDNDKELYNLIIKISGSNKKFYNEIDDTKQKLKNRYELIMGEIESGNNNEKILSELKDILEKLYHMKIITYKNLKEHYNDIYNNYFK